MNLNLLKTTVEDLDHISETFVPHAKDDDIRRASTSLRRLVVDNDLQKTWKEIGYDKQPMISAPSMEFHLKHPDAPHIHLAAALGGTIDKFRPMHLCLFYKQPEKRIDAPRTMDKVVLPLSKYKESCSLIVDGAPLTRRQVIQFVANKMGGAHYDEKERDPAFERLGTMDMAVSLGPPDNSIVKERRNLIYLELLSIGQSVTSAKDVRNMLSRARSYIV